MPIWLILSKGDLMVVESSCVRFKNVLIDDARSLSLGGIVAASVILPVQAVSLHIFQIAGFVSSSTSFQTTVRCSVYDGFRLSAAQINHQQPGLFEENSLLKRPCFWGEFARQMNVINADFPDKYTNPFLLKMAWTTTSLWQVMLRELVFRYTVQDLVMKQMVKRVVKAVAPSRESVVNTYLVKATRVILTTLYVCQSLPNEYFTDLKKRMHLAALIIVQLGTGMIKESSLGLRGALGARAMHQLAISGMIWTDC